MRALFLSILASPVLLGPAEGEPFSAICPRYGDEYGPPVGGQAVLEGVVMRHENACAMAVRQPDGGILAESRPWRSLFGGIWTKTRFLRGFPIMLETLLNGVDALTRSAELSGEENERLSPAMLIMALAVALGLGVGLFVVLPHVLTVVLESVGVSADMRGFSFHVWDGLFKFGIFFVYIAVISNMADIRRVFQYHGAEHKVIGAWEEGGEVSARTAAKHSRLHPRCGTTFLLFVLALAMAVHALLLPPLVRLWEPEGDLARHVLVIAVKVLLVVPMSALAYELIRVTSRMKGFWGRLFCFPGLMLQLLTTREPDMRQLDVAVVALAESLGDEYAHRFQTPAYTVLE